MDKKKGGSAVACDNDDDEEEEEEGRHQEPGAVRLTPCYVLPCPSLSCHLYNYRQEGTPGNTTESMIMIALQ